MLIVFAGLPGTGKTTLSRAVARQLNAAWIRIDAIEAAMWRAGVAKSEPTGLAAYSVAWAVAEAQLALDLSAVVDAVNPVEEARQGWRDLAAAFQKPLREIEVVCSDREEHRRRVQSRQPDLAGHTVPTWEEVSRWRYEPWHGARLVVDTVEPHSTSVDQVLRFLA